MALADWLLPLLLITLEDEHGRFPFEWAVLDGQPALQGPPAPPALA